MKRTITLLVLLFPVILISQTILPGGYVSGVWNLCNSPYQIEGNITIDEGDTLILEAGVTVIFMDNHLFIIHGSLIAKGTEQDSVRFVSVTELGSKGLYEGAQLFFSSWDSVASSLKYSTFKDIIILSYGFYHLLTIDHSSFSNSELYLWDITAVIENSYLFQTKFTGIYSDISFNNSIMDGKEVYFYPGGSLYTNFLKMKDFEIKNSDGCGIWASYAIIDLRNGMISNNAGSGLILESDPGSSYNHAHLENVLVEGNGTDNSLWFHSGVNAYYYSIYINNSVIRNNNGGGIHHSMGRGQISNTIIENNFGSEGGGLIIDDSYEGNLIIDKTIIRNNFTSGNGGGISIPDYLPFQERSLTIRNSSIYGNSAANGGGISVKHVHEGSILFENLEITNNYASDKGGGFFMKNILPYGNLQNMMLANLTIADNVAVTAGGGLYYDESYNVPPLQTYYNNISWKNSPDQISGFNLNSIQFNYSNIQNGWPGIGNIDTDPMFTDPVNGDYSLSWANFPVNDTTKSPCIDTGDPTFPNDPDNTPADMGASFFDQATPFKPLILSITDVPGDQGKQVEVTWKAAITDTPAFAEISHYTLWRKNPGGTTWNFLGSIPADYSAEYAYIAPTLSDSTAAGIPYYTFRVIAQTADPAIFYVCPPDSGYSVDNLPPVIPDGLTGIYANGYVELSWNPSPDDDFDHFRIYKSGTAGGDFGFIAMSVSNLFSDSYFTAATVSYRVSAVDVNGNESLLSSPVQLSVTPGFDLDAKIWMEGPFNGSGMNTWLKAGNVLPLAQPYSGSPWNYPGDESVMEIPGTAIVDWILLEIREAPHVNHAVSSAMVARQAAFLLEDGSIAGLDGTSLPRFNIEPSADLYVVIMHRNHLGALAAESLSHVDGRMVYDFTTGAEKYYRGDEGCKEFSPGLWGMVAGDINADGIIDISDKTGGWSLEAGHSGYLESDLNLDANTDNLDKNEILIVNMGYQAQVPGETNFNCGDLLFDYRDNRYYQTVQIGDQCWMAENLNAGVMICGGEESVNNGIIEKYCYDNLPENCEQYGGFYTWDEMMGYTLNPGVQGICPLGWYVPTDAEWCVLQDFVDSGNINCQQLGWKGTDAGNKLKSTSGWYENGNGSDLFGFNAKPAGYRSSTDGNFYRLTRGSYLWSSDQNNANTAWRTGMDYNFNTVNRAYQNKNDGRSVRCIKD